MRLSRGELNRDVLEIHLSHVTLEVPLSVNVEVSKEEMCCINYC